MIIYGMDKKIRRIRPFRVDDELEVRKIHQMYYDEEFELPNFGSFPSTFTTTDDAGKVVAVGGVRPIFECIVVTDKSQSIFVRRASYFNILNSCSLDLQNHGIHEIHAFVQGDRWIEALRKMGFHDTAGRALVLEI